MSRKLTLLVILLVGTLTQIATDIYTPSLPAISQALHTTLGAVQLTMTWFILGVALTGLFYGPLSEVIGRRWAIIIGTVIAIIGSVVCLFAKDIMWLQIGRLIQGLGLGAASALWRSIFRDTYSGETMAKMASYLTNVIILSVIAAPFIGGYIEQYANWRVTFIVLLAWMIVVLFIVAFFFKETGQHYGKHRFSVKFLLSAYRELLLSRLFMGMCFCVLLTYGGLFTWITAGPVVLIHGAHISPVLFGYLSIFVGAAYSIGGTVNGKLVKKFGMTKMLISGWTLMLIAGLLTLLGKVIFGINVYVVLIPALLFLIGSTFIFANAVAAAFTPFGHIAGYAGSLYSSIQLLGGVIFTALLSHFNTSSQLPMGWMFVASGAFAMAVFVVIAKPKITK